jgi:hypothetical protein
MTTDGRPETLKELLGEYQAKLFIVQGMDTAAEGTKKHLTELLVEHYTKFVEDLKFVYGKDVQ